MVLYRTLIFILVLRNLLNKVDKSRSLYYIYYMEKIGVVALDKKFKEEQKKDPRHPIFKMEGIEAGNWVNSYLIKQKKRKNRYRQEM